MARLRFVELDGPGPQPMVDSSPMGGSRAVWSLATVALASSGAIGCGTSTSSSNGGAGLGGGAGQASAGTSAQGNAGRPSGGAGAGGSSGSNASMGGMSGSGGGGGALAGTGGALAGTSGTAGGSGTAAAGGVSGSPGAAGKAGGDSGGASSGAGGQPPSLDCSGTFGEPRVVLLPDASRVFSPTLGPDETELLYAMGEDMSLQYFRSTRASKLEEFSPGVALPELDAACEGTEDRTIDLTPDGLRAYLVCYGTSGSSYHLHIAVRPTLDAPFVLDPESYGQVGPSAAIAPGELTLYSSAPRPGQDPPLVFERTTTQDSFDAGTAIPGLGDTPLLTPDVSTDGLSLFGSFMGGVVVATRATANDDFALQDFVVPPPDFGQWISATISEDCRSLYAVRQDGPPMVEVFTR